MRLFSSIFDVILIVIVIAMLLFFVLLLQYTGAQEIDTNTTTTQMFEYDGWQNKTTLRSRTWDATDKPPEPNERLYIYRNGIQQKGYYQWDGYNWEPRGGAYTRSQEEEGDQ